MTCPRLLPQPFRGDDSGAVARRRTNAPAPTPRASTTVSTALVSAVLVALNLIVYWGVQRFEFVNWDDPTYLTENTNVQAGLSAANVWWALTTGHSPVPGIR